MLKLCGIGVVCLFDTGKGAGIRLDGVILCIYHRGMKQISWYLKYATAVIVGFWGRFV